MIRHMTLEKSFGFSESVFSSVKPEYYLSTEMIATQVHCKLRFTDTRVPRITFS